MCVHYELVETVDAISDFYQVANAAVGANFGKNVFPGYPGLVIAQGEVRVMSWGFPLAMRSKKTGQPLKPKPVNNTRDDKLLTPFWKDSFTHRRCLIPATRFAEAEGEKGRMTRTWISDPESPVMTIAGIWRESEEWGPVYSMVTCEPSEQTARIHDRMPVILPPRSHQQWLEGSPAKAQELCKPPLDDLSIDRTVERWS